MTNNDLADRLEADVAEAAAPPEPAVSPAMAQWVANVRARDLERQRELEAANAKLRDTVIDLELARSRSSNEPTEMVALKIALQHVPVDDEWVRRRLVRGEIEGEQRGSRWFVALASLFREVKASRG
jgi:hypothetical protein